MTMTTVSEEREDVLAKLEAQTDFERVDVSAVAIINRSEVEAQLDAAHKHRRSIRRFVLEAQGLATLTRDVAESCIYSIPRDGKMIAGPSVRLAEIAASAYGNLHVGSRVVDEQDRHVVAQGVAWDLEKNLRVSVETKRRITGKGGKRFNDDMITVTGNAAASIALRNAIFRVIPRAYVEAIYSKVKEVAVGNASTLTARRDEVIARLGKLGVTPDRVLLRLGRAGIGDVGLEDLETLIGLGTAIKAGDQTVDQAFPPVAETAAPVPTDTRTLEEKLKAKAAKAPEKPATREPGED